MKKFISVCACCVRDEGNRVTSLEHFYPKKRRKREREGGTHAFWRGAEVCCLDCRRQADEPQAERESCRGIASQGPGVCRFVARDCFAGSRSMQLSVAGLPRSVRGYAGLQRGIASQGQGDTDLWRGMVSERGGVRAMYRAPCIHSLSGSWRTSRRLCFVSERTVGSKRFAFGELAHIEALVFCV